MLEFYEVDMEYIKYLQKYEKQLCVIYNFQHQFKHTQCLNIVCGVVLQINNNEFYAPILQECKLYNYVSLDSRVLLMNMFPANKSVLRKLPDDIKYQPFHQNENIILEQAKHVYYNFPNKHAWSADFHLLESIYHNYTPT